MKPIPYIITAMVAAVAGALLDSALNAWVSTPVQLRHHRTEYRLGRLDDGLYIVQYKSDYNENWEQAGFVWAEMSEADARAWMEHLRQKEDMTVTPVP